MFAGSNVRWSITKGKRHLHIRVEDRLIAILPLAGGTEEGRALKNIRAQVRRSIRLAQEAQA
jgi:hypothetical protein